MIVCPTGRGGPAVVAYDVETGKPAWHAGTVRASYASPQIVELSGVRQVLLYAEPGLVAFELPAGRELWQFPWTNSVRNNAAQPIAHAGGRDQVFVSTGYGQGCALVKIARGSGGSFTAQPLWTNNDLRSKFASPVLHKGHVYGLDDGILSCLRLSDGRRLWKAGRYGHGQLLLAGDLLLVQAESGEVVLVEPDPAELRERGRIPALDGKTWNHPALSGQYLLVRNQEEAACYELPQNRSGGTP